MKPVSPSELLARHPSRRPPATTPESGRDAARGATVTEVPGSHSIYVSNPGAVAGLIAQAARSLAPTGSVA